ncbi:MAG TPA: AbrB/MazE/SpoVT family DNA-binding domain-containing protein [Clostridia bacterium]
MDIAKLTSKGQLTLPVKIRKKLGLDTGDQVAFIEKDGTYVMVNANKLSYTRKIPSINISSIEASLNMEGLDVSKDSITYAKNRLKNKATYISRVAQIKSKFTSR